MKLPLGSFITSIFGLALFVLALVTLRHELGSVKISDVQAAYHGVPPRLIITAFLLTVLSYLILSLNDFLSIRFVGKRIARRHILKGSFLGYALSHSLGFAPVTGGAARFGVYSRCGLSSVEIVKATAFNAFTFWLTIIFILSGVAVLSPSPLASRLAFSPFQVQLAGGLLLSAACVLLVLLRVFRIKINEWEIALPSLRLTTAGILVGTVDWATVAYASYALLPALHAPFPLFFAVFVSAEIAGVLSHVPGGLGVVEAGLLSAFSGRAPAAAILGPFLVFRIVYYLVPFGAALFILVSDEIHARKEHILLVAGMVKRGASAILPQILSVLTLISGALLLLSGAKPPPRHAYSWIEGIVPLPLIELSHFAGSIVGIGLIILARGIRRRLDSAYYLVSLGLGLAATATIIRGGHAVESIALVGVLILLLVCKESFYRKGSLLGGEFEPKWIFVVAVTLLSTGWILMFAFQHVEYSHSLWWEFSLQGHAPRALRGFVGAVVVFATWGWLRLLSPSQLEPALPDDSALADASSIVARSVRTYAHLALLGDKHFLFNEDRTAFVMYAVQGNCCIAMGDPVGPENQLPGMLIEFADHCDLHGYDMAVYQANHASVTAYLDMGFYLVKLGEEAMVDLEDFNLEGSKRSWLRRNRTVLMREGYSFSVIEPPDVARRMDEFSSISNDWMGAKETEEKRFSLGSFIPRYLMRFPFAVIEHEGRAVAFSNVLRGFDNVELSVDLMRYGSEAPRGVMDFMFTELLLWGKEQGYKSFNLGMAPLSGLEIHQLAPLWNRVGSLVFRHGEHFYNFQGLRAYKEKFAPVWEPRYLATSGVMRLPVVLTNVAALISGGYRGIFTK